MEVSRGGSSLIRGSYRKPAREGGAHNNENDEEKMVVTQRAECAHSGTRGEDPGVNNKQVSNEDHLPNSPAQGPSGHSGPDMHQTNESLLSSSTDLHKGEEVERVSKVLVTACPKRVLRHPQNGDQDKVMEKMMEEKKSYVPKWFTYAMKLPNTASNLTETLQRQK